MSGAERDRLRGQAVENWHQGITMHRLRFGGGVAGLIFTVGSMLIFLMGVPGIWFFFLLALLCGIVIGLALAKKPMRPPLSLK